MLKLRRNNLNKNVSHFSQSSSAFRKSRDNVVCHFDGILSTEIVGRHDRSCGEGARLLAGHGVPRTKSYLIRPDSCNDLSLRDYVRKCDVYPIMSRYRHFVLFG